MGGLVDPPWQRLATSPRARGSSAGGAAPLLRPSASLRRGSGGSGVGPLRYKGHPPGSGGGRRSALLAAACLVVVGYISTCGPSSPPSAPPGRGAAALVRSPAGSSTLPATSSLLGCVAWRQTGACSPYAERDAPRDKACHERVWIGSGFCECEGGAVARPVPCGRHGGFTCARECAAMAAGEGAAAAAVPGDPAPRLPSNLTCEAGGPTAGVLAGDAASKRAALAEEAAAAARAAGGLDSAWAPGSPALVAADAAAGALWRAITAAAVASWGASTPPGRRVTLPERRTDGRDWVRDGVRLPKKEVVAAAAALASFRSLAPPFPANASSLFSGRGIVILGGGLTYTVPAWVALHMLRRAGCGLPVEVWFPPAEAPTPGLVDALAALGAGVRILPTAPPPANGGLGPSAGRPLGGGPAGAGDLSGFTMKVAALVLSRFSEALFLDSDNVPVSDPAALFDTPAFKETGALLWPDYWASTAAPDLATILGVPSLPSGTFESGQLVFDKPRTWPGLMASAYFNIESDLYYELFSGFMGAVGRTRTRCALNQRVCVPGFAGNTMTQHAFPVGDEEAGTPPTIAFLHANLSPKWNLALPATPTELARRWVSVQPGGRPFAALASDAGLPDLEAEAFAIAARFACAPFVRAYADALAAAAPVVVVPAAAATGARGGGGGGAKPPPPPLPPLAPGAPLSRGLPPHTFHPANPGIDFRAAYRWGLDGPFRGWAGCTAGDGVVHFINAHARPWGAWARRVGRWAVGRDRFFVPL